MAMKRATNRAFWFLLLCSGLIACTGGPAPSPAATFTPTATATATLPPPTATVTPEPTPTATPSPVPTPNPATLATAAKRGLAQVRAAAGDAELVCFHYEDTDGDGAPEWLALTRPPGVARLSAFILDGEAFYALPAAQPEPGKPDYGLGQYATCEVEIRDVNGDGRPEVAIFGHAAANETLLHLYVWENDTYRLLGAFSGTAGIFFKDDDGDLAEEIVEGHHERAAPELAWQVIFTWDEQTYGWTWDRWAWFFLARPHAYPTHQPKYAVISFYLALNDRDLPGAYALMTSAAQAVRPYADWALGFATTTRVEVNSVTRIPGIGDETHARVSALVTSWDNEAGRIIARTWEIKWETELTPDGWRIAGGTMDLLDTWEAKYWK